jgi:hypothetical protein
VEGALEALSNIRHNTGTPVPPAGVSREVFTKDVLVSLADCFAKARRRYKLPAPAFSPWSLRGHKFDSKKNAGYFNVYQRDIETAAESAVELVNSSTQGEAYPFTINHVMNIANTVRRHVTLERPYSRDWFPTLAAKIAVKAEVRGYDAPETKTRIFFIMCMIKLLIDKELYSEPFKMFYGTDYCSIGHKWTEGGADKIAREMHAWDEDWSWFTTDISKLDQRLHPGLLTLIFASIIAMYDRKPQDQNYAVLKAFLCFSADDIAATLIKWTGLSFRIIVGVMFSGLFGTSWGDTVYVSIAIKCALRHFQRTIQNKMARGDVMPVVKVYGDNIAIGWTTKRLREFVLGPGDDPMKGFFAEYLLKTFGLPLKADETFFHTKFFTTINEHFSRDTGMWRTRVIGKPGVVFLKRYFIEREFAGERWAMPFRPVADFYDRIITTNHTDSHSAVWIARWCGLLLDTCGTNREAHKALMFFISRHLGSHKLKSFNNFEEMANWYVEQVPEYWMNRVKKLGVPPEFTKNLYSPEKIEKLFAPKPKRKEK